MLVGSWAAGGSRVRTAEEVVTTALATAAAESRLPRAFDFNRRAGHHVLAPDEPDRVATTAVNRD
ncbi:hypothetical protein GCM10010185_45920 [Saccharothrix coeruleofusca]|uniref:Uncharacterized protein n=1 Tax=Saccharothrix coeruleofusca TaxID=33919 RepID=A0A918AQ74_9PSEU|nr:hypothetical protein GCM10010185_45920 [Saccharothrix coeruleofusca]